MKVYVLTADTYNEAWGSENKPIWSILNQRES